MGIYRIQDSGEVVGCIVARSKPVAEAYALGKYGAGSSVERVSHKEAVQNMGVCVLIATRERHVNPGPSPKTVREIE